MISKLTIENIALIEKAEIEFQNGLNVISGETGSGKSLVVYAISFALGDKAKKTLIRSGADSARVRIVLNDINEKTKAMMREFGLDDSEDILIIDRKMTTENKNEIKINGEQVTLGMLKQLSLTLVEMYGQFEHASLLNIDEHVKILDNYNDKIKAVKDEFASVIVRYKEILNKIDELGGDSQKREQAIDMYQYAVKEIDEINPKIGEDDELQAQKNLMQNSEKLTNNYSQSLNALREIDGSVLGLLSISIRALNNIANVDEQAGVLGDRLQSCGIEIEDVCETITEQLGKMDFSEAEFNKIDARLDAIKRLKKKYGVTIEDILNYRNEISAKLDAFSESEILIKKLNIELDTVWQNILNFAKKLHELREITAREIEINLVAHLKELNMEKSKVGVSIESVDKERGESINVDSFDKVEFLFSANSGEPVKPLNKVISGGELSRFMLAVKCIEAKNDNITTLILDEIDAGISGITGQSMAKKLSSIAQNVQIITVSHLAYIVAIANANYLSAKATNGDRTQSSIIKLNDGEQLQEISRIVGGQNISNQTALFSKDLQDWGKQNRDAK